MCIRDRIYILLVLVCFVALFPFYWLINTSLQSPEELFKLPIHYFPTNHLFEAYGEYIRDSSILVWLKNTLIVSGTTCVIATAVGTPAAYALSRFRFRLKTAYTFLILFTQMMSAAFLCIPTVSYTHLDVYKRQAVDREMTRRLWK